MRKPLRSYAADVGARTRQTISANATLPKQPFQPWPPEPQKARSDARWPPGARNKREACKRNIR
eukprot:1449503-Pyramimonas_sp.AAC.1